MTQTREPRTTPAPPAAIDQAKLEAFLGKVVDEVGAAYNTVLTAIGDQLGLYRVLADTGPLTSADLAERSGTAERYVREWANAQAASGFLRYDADAGTYELPPEQAFVLADETSPVYLAGIFQGAPAVFGLTPRIVEGFRTGQGVGWHEHGAALFEGTERFFRSGYRANLVSDWIPALDGVEEKLRRGVAVADVGCGHGASTLLLAEAFPSSTFVGFDYHQASIDAARQRAADAGLGADRVRFEVAGGDEYPGTYDVVAIFDALHDMGDPLAVARHVRESLTPDGTFMLFEPAAGDGVADNLNPVGRLYYAISTMVCTPASLAQPGRAALGAQAGPARLGAILTEAGFTRVREAARTPFNIVLEARP
ncbi:class I SAM-dependent methyltransferase [Actinomycetospora lemnae]|uniref:Class I SAM-dependent methyltransferase n=1 Tax=Actinomycetospora lemnae TaxID=3019891 RepID=A0ABT5SSH1_9PSEU|nr:class I SAM-dependent methyltransferase [Actinomycetospora sp. DW7H6]MDD7965646.1 class I SAM-dependent methyltransferase [Actinomycetospora sp. DW7H6]